MAIKDNFINDDYTSRRNDYKDNSIMLWFIKMTKRYVRKSETHVQKQKWYDLCFGTT